MTNTPPANNGGAADLGSAYSTIGYTYDARGMQQFVQAAQQAIAAQQKITQTNQQATQLAKQQATAQQQVARAQQQGVAAQQQAATQAQRIAQREAQVARALGDTRAELAALGRAQQAAISNREQYLAVTAQVIRAEQRLNREQSQRQTGPAVLPRTFAGFTSAGAIQAAGFATAAGLADKLAGKMVELGTESIDLAKKAETIGRAYEGATARAGIASDGLIKTLKAAARETVTTTELQASANKALALGVGQNAEQIGQLLAIARQKGKDFGIDTAQAFEDITTGLGRLSPRILDNLGIILDETKIYGQYAAAIGKSTQQLSDQEKRQALVNELIRTNSDLLEKNATAALDNADRQAVAAAKRAEALQRLGKALIPLQTGAAESTAALLETVTGGLAEQKDIATANLTATADSYEQYSTRVDAANQAIGISVQALVEQLTGIKPPAWLVPFTNQVEKLSPAEFQAARGLEAYGVAAEQAQRQVRGVHDISESINQTFGDVYDTLQELAPQLLTIAATSPQAADKIRALIAEFQQTGDQQAFQRGVDALSTSLEEQATKAEYAALATRNKAAADKAAADAAATNAEAQKSMGQAYIDAAKSIEDAQQRRTQATRDLDKEHAQRVADLNERSQEAAADTAQQLADTEAEGAEQRAQIVSDTQDRIQKIERDSAKRRDEILRDFHEKQAQQERERARDQAEAEQSANVSRLQSYSTFLGKLDDLANKSGRQGQKIRREALAAQQAAIAEANQLATIDPEAAARLLALRREQITDDLERKRENQQRLRDARRGGSLTTGQVKQEIQDEQQAQRQANDAEAQFIKDSAARKQQQREEDRQAQQDNLARQLADLEQNTKDQLAETQDAGAKRLAEFDKQQAKRIAQIEKHGREQQAAITKQLAAEQQNYEDKQAEIEQDYSDFLDNLRDQLNDRASELFHPNETQQRLLAEAYHTLGETLGKALLDGINAQTDQGFRPPPLTGGGPYGTGTTPLPQTSSGGTRTYQRGSVVGVRTDPVLSDQAIDQVVLGARESDGYSSVRGGALHGGVDLATPLDTPVKSPIDGTVVAVGATKEGGNYLIVQGANGDQWYFGHLSRATVRQGTLVKRGQVIARSGATGTAITGPHLHLQLRRGGRVIDPTQALETISGTSAATTGSGTSGSASGSAVPRTGGSTPLSAQGVTPAAFDVPSFGMNPRLRLSPTTQTTQTIQLGAFQPSIVVSGAGASAQEIVSAIDQRLRTWEAEYTNQQLQTIRGMATRGERRTV